MVVLGKVVGKIIGETYFKRLVCNCADTVHGLMTWQKEMVTCGVLVQRYSLWVAFPLVILGGSDARSPVTKPPVVRGQ